MVSSEVPQNGTTVELIYLTFWDKVAISAGAVGFLLLISMCMVCFLCPECFCHGFCFGEDDPEEKKKKQSKNKKFGSQKSTSSKSSYGSTESDYFYSAPPPDATDSGPIKWKPLDIIKERELSDWSSDTGSGQEVIKLGKMKRKSLIIHDTLLNGDVHDDLKKAVEGGSIDFSLSYSVSEERLTIKIQEVKNVQVGDEKTLVSPYVKVRIYKTPKQFFTFREHSDKGPVINNLEKEFKTKMHRPSECLSYKESFEIAVDLETLKSFTLRFLLCDMDKLSRHVILGETSVILKKTELWTVRDLKFSEKFRSPVEENLGTISVGLSYLPTSEKMYLSVESIKGLKVMDKMSASTDACVKVYLMYEGKQLKRVKTTVRASDLNPVFNESFSFDVPNSEVEKVYFSLVVCHYDAETKSSKIIGRVYTGMNFDTDAREHWSSMVQNPRKKIVTSYKIKN
ncbi:synaptotagmin-1-like [Mercenaria mercenaria]|uniref:synaptotagmin-1-like n=1 Tax=Mercenaria mercenaria TaxID=6596 RepID=UPI00234EA873|nr:synaptotagmin-1-like [Mercenaria mercenaria]XP_053379144.1 synaptotagmin-1-like [Mercenaria mercenaria]XP_053379145.1 synaptotagmin-1-like [Mercenaria mercenaria]XP_053379146.1 synaptotagmin-1-like [Mercenaria mercenaria]